MDEPKLYRFFADNLNNFTALTSSYLWFSHIHDFNDPFEGCTKELTYYVDADSFSDADFITMFKNSSAVPNSSRLEREKILLARMRQGQKEWRRFKDEMLNVFAESHKRVMKSFEDDYYWCCFSTASEQLPDPASSQLMWSHYANGLRGFVIEFDKQSLLDSLDAHHGEDVLMTRIVYDNLKPMDFHAELANLTSRNASELERLGGLKSKEWEYESEFRIGARGNLVNYSPETIVRVIIGDKMSSESRALIQSILRGHDELKRVPVEVAYVDRRDYRIKTRPLDDTSAETNSRS